MWLHTPTNTRPTESAPVDGCTVLTSPYGYPDWYIGHAQTYGAHPPAPESGWRGSSEHVGFNVLFHSLFHGYTVVQYRTDMSPETMETLRKWVLLHAEERVTAASAPSDAPVAVDVAKWGQELSCTDTASLTVRRLDQLLSP
jgi:uncharacterized protein DUF3105